MLGRLLRTIRPSADSTPTVGADMHAGAVSLGGAVELHVPDGVSTEPARGWRAWDVQRSFDGAPRLVSPDLGFVWHPNILWQEAMPCRPCQVRRNPDCRCGFNAWASREQLDASRYASRAVVGEVELSGEVGQFEGGWRGPQARPLRLHLHEGEVELAKELAELYHCEAFCDRPVVVLNTETRYQDPPRWAAHPWRWALGAFIASATLNAGIWKSMSNVLVNGQTFPAWLLSVMVFISLLAPACISLRFTYKCAQRVSCILFIIAAVGSFASALVVIGASSIIGTSLGDTEQRVARTGGHEVVYLTKRNALHWVQAATLPVGSCRIHHATHRFTEDVQLCRTKHQLWVKRRSEGTWKLELSGEPLPKGDAPPTEQDELRKR